MENANGDDWQEELFQRIRSMKDMYLPHVVELYQRAAVKLQREESLPQQQRSEQFEKLIRFKRLLELIIQFLSVPKSYIMPVFKDKVAYYEKKIIGFLNMYSHRMALGQGKLPLSQMNSGSVS